MPPLVFVQNRGDEDWIDNAEEELSSLHSVEFCRRAKSPQFPTIWLDSSGRRRPSYPEKPPQYRINVSDTAVAPCMSLFLFFRDHVD